MNMLQRLFSTFLFVFCLFAINLSYAQTVPGQMSYQGKLNDANGIPYTGSINIRFVITATDAGGVQQQWSQTQTLSVVNGLYSATLGASGNFIPTEIFTKNNPTLSIFIDGVQLLPSISLLSVPYSFFAEHVGSLSDDMVETQHILNGTIKLEDLEADIINQNTLLYMTPAGDLRWRDADEFVRTDQLTSIQESTVANNGLTLTGRAVRLGGPLIQDTNIDLATSSLSFTTTTGNITINPTGDFSLPLGTQVNNIVTVINNADYKALATEGAVFEFVNATTSGLVSASNGLNTPTLNEVALGGALTGNTNITTNTGSTLTIDGTGNFNVQTANVAIESNTGDLDLTGNSEVNINSTTGDVKITSNGSEVALLADNVSIDAPNGTQIETGSFALNNSGLNSVFVSEIVTLINSDNDINLVTEGAVFNAITSATSGLVQANNGLSLTGINQVGLGGVLTAPTTIETQASNDLLINGGGNLSIETEQVDITSTNQNLSLNTNNGEIVIDASTKVNISSINGTEVSAGTFGLIPTGVTTTVDAIVTLIDDHNDDNLITEGAVFDFVNSNVSKAGSGLTQNGQNIDLGGALIDNANIDGGGSHFFTVQSVNALTLQAGGQIDIDAFGNLLDLTGEDVAIDANGSTGSGNVGVTATNNINISALTTQITAGTFGLNGSGGNITTVNEIVSVISGNSNDQLITEGAVVDFVNSSVSKAGSGLTQNGQAIDLGGTLNANTIIDGVGSHSFTVQDVSDLTLQTAGDIDIDAASEVNIGNTSGDDIDLSGVVQVVTGTFALENGTTVNNIVTIFDRANIEDDLATEGAVLDLVSGLAGSGLTFNGTNIDLGGNLTTGAHINGQGEVMDIHNVSSFDLQSNNLIDINAASLLGLTGESIDVSASGGDLDISSISGNINIVAVTSNIVLEANGVVVSSGTDVGITASNDIGIAAVNDIGINAESIYLESNDEILLATTGAGGTQIIAGTFSLPSGTSVDNIVTVFDGSNIEHDLATEAAVIDLVSGLAGSGLTFNGVNNEIDLGGSLTTGAHIDGQGEVIDIHNVSSLELQANGEAVIEGGDVILNSSNDIDINALADMTIISNGIMDITGTDINIEASNDITIGNAAGDDIDLNGVVQVTTGTFALENGTTVNNIVTAFDGVNIEDDLATEGAVLDLVSGLAGSGLSLNTTTLAIDLAGDLTTGAHIDGQGEVVDIHNVSSFDVQSNNFIDIYAASLLNLTSESIDISASGGDLDISSISGNINIAAVTSNIVLEANSVIVSSGTDVGITASNDIGIVAVNDIGINAESIYLESNDEILLATTGAGGTQIIVGTFSLPSGTSVDNIVTVIDGLNIEDDLVTEAAVIDLVGGLAGSGLTFNGGAIDLGGALTANTIVTGSFNFGVNVGGTIDLTATGGGDVRIDADNDVAINANNNINIVTINGEIGLNTSTGGIDLSAHDNSFFSITTGDLTLTSDDGDIFIDATITQIVSGTFALETGAEVNEIATVIFPSAGLPNDDDNTLLTAKAIADFVFDNTASFSNGLTNVGGGDIGLGGMLTLATSTINLNGNALLINDTAGGIFGIDANKIAFQSVQDLDLISETDDIILEAQTGNILILATATTANVSMNTKEVFIEHHGSADGVETALTLNRHAPTGGAANGIGEKILFRVEDDNGNLIPAASLEVSLASIISQHSQVELSMLNLGTRRSGLILDGATNSVILGDGVVTTDTKIGIGERNPQTTLHVVGDIELPATGINGHVVAIENISDGSPPSQNVNGLAISLGVTSGSITAVNETNNFVTFFARNNANTSNEAVGAIELIENGGVSFSASGADYAEWLERKEITEKIETADIVGIFGGQITKNTENAEQFRVVSTSPIVLGNRPSEDNSKETHEKIAFLGQVPVKVKGAVQTGDYIIPSGKNDGVGIAVSAQNITASQFAQVIGMAWGSSNKQNVKKINVAIGLDTPQKAIARLMENSKKQENLIQELQKELTALRNQNTAVKSDNVELKAQAEKMDKMQSQIDLMMQMMKSGQQKETLNAEDDK